VVEVVFHLHLAALLAPVFFRFYLSLKFIGRPYEPQARPASHEGPLLAHIAPELPLTPRLHLGV